MCILPDKRLSGWVQVQPSSVTSSSTRSEAPSQYSSVTDAPHQPERLLEPRRSFTVQAAMQEVAQPDAVSQPVYTDSNQGTHCYINASNTCMLLSEYLQTGGQCMVVCLAAISTGGSSVSTAPVTSVNVGLPPLPPAMSAWRQAQELTRKAEEEAMLAEKKSQEAYVWYVPSMTGCQAVSQHVHHTHKACLHTCHLQGSLVS